MKHANFYSPVANTIRNPVVFEIGPIWTRWYEKRAMKIPDAPLTDLSSSASLIERVRSVATTDLAPWPNASTAKGFTRARCSPRSDAPACMVRKWRQPRGLADYATAILAMAGSLQGLHVHRLHDLGVRTCGLYIEQSGNSAPIEAPGKATSRDRPWAARGPVQPDEDLFGHRIDAARPVRRLAATSSTARCRVSNLGIISSHRGSMGSRGWRRAK